MKKLIFLIVAIVAFATSSFAYTDGHAVGLGREGSHWNGSYTPNGALTHLWLESYSYPSGAWAKVTYKVNETTYTSYYSTYDGAPAVGPIVYADRVDMIIYADPIPYGYFAWASCWIYY